jgi:hypothetical protein
MHRSARVNREAKRRLALNFGVNPANVKVTSRPESPEQI